MALYIKLPDTIEAWKVGTENHPQWIDDLFERGEIEEKTTPDGRKYLKILTYTGYQYAENDDYVVFNTLENGGVFTIGKEKFEKSYRLQQ